MSKWSECAHTSGVWRVCARALAHAAFTRGVGVNAWSVVLTRRHSYNNQSHTSLVLHERDWVFAWGDLIGWHLRWRLKSCVSTTLQTRPPSSVDADAPCECSVSQSAIPLRWRLNLIIFKKRLKTDLLHLHLHSLFYWTTYFLYIYYIKKLKLTFSILFLFVSTCFMFIYYKKI